MIVYRLTALFLVLGGLFLIATVTLPIVTYEVFTARRFVREEEKFLSPLGNNKVLSAKVVDLTRASNWFSGEVPISEPKNISQSIRYYTFSIPKLKIDKATAEVGGEDLSKSLIHYKGTALPGQIGNTVIFGHSVLPQFFNPQNYMTIFSTLPTLKLGDEVTINYDGITYRFTISEMFEVSPNDVYVLAQPNDRPHLTIITCVPPGTYLRRLVIKADLVPPKI